MKKLTRIGILITVIGASLLLITILRSSFPETTISVGGKDTAPGRWDLYPDLLFSPRNLRLEVNSNVTAEAYILDQNGIKLWTSTETISSIASLTGVKQEFVTTKIGERGAYGILVHNASAEPGTVKAIVTLYGLEEDLLYGSIAIVVIGLITFIGSLTDSVLKKEKQT